MTETTYLFTAGLSLLLTLSPGPASDAKIQNLLARIKAIGSEGTGNKDAQRAWRELVHAGPVALPPILSAFDEASPVASNWLRAAVDAIAEASLGQGQSLPPIVFERFLQDTRNSGPARRLAFEWLARVDPGAPDRLLPGMLQDPGAELRRDAIARAYKQAQKSLEHKDKTGATRSFQELFHAARDRDQVDQLAKDLKNLGINANVTAHYGFITRWLLIGPFDNTKGVGFSKAYPPEQKVSPGTACAGKNGSSLHWKDFRTPDVYGLVDLNSAIGKNMGAVAYAFAAIELPTASTVELRAATNNAAKVFLNGKQVFFREEYHHGMRMDQYTAKVILNLGRNEVLVKICQNEQTDAWAQSWSFQLRVCDALGGASPVKVITDNVSGDARRERKNQ